MNEVRLLDYGPAVDTHREEVVAGLRRRPKQLPCKLLYDERGSELFERICTLEEYYLTRTEISILREHMPAIARRLGPECLVIEYGSGAGDKTLLLLDELEEPVAYFPIDISKDALLTSAERLQDRYPDVEVVPVCADYTEAVELPRTRRRPRRRVVFFPGSTIGNFDHSEAAAFLRRLAQAVGEGGALLVGIDLQKDPKVLESAYDDAAGVTAEFNLNILVRLNRELGATFRVDRFRHRALYDEERGRIEMHLVSREDQTVEIGEESFSFRSGETIWTESSYKYRIDQFRKLARASGFEVEKVWTDRARWFGVLLLEASA